MEGDRTSAFIIKMLVIVCEMKKILAIDGGGIKGVYAASLLTEIERLCGGNICDYFDMLAGTSTGAIIAAALSIKIPAHEILELYMDKGKEIFPKEHWKLFRGKYSTQPLKNELKKIFDDKKMNDARTRLLIPTYNLNTDAVQIFKTPHAVDLYFDKDKKMHEVLLATTAAPIYFSPYKMSGGVYVDGGVGANNPSLIALVEGITRCDWNKEDIVILNIGSVTSGKQTTGKEKMGLSNFLILQKCFMNAENQYASNICKLIIGDNYIRIEETVPTGEVALDKVDKTSIEKLSDLGINSAQNYYDLISEKFLSDKSEQLLFK